MMKHLTLVVLLLLLPIGAVAQILPADVCATLRTQRATIAHDPVTPAELATILDVTAGIYRADGWGLSAKPAGTNCPRSDGVRIACDILQRGPLIWDVLASAGDPGGSIVVCGDAMPAPTDPSRPWVAPLGSAPIPTPTPGPTPMPTPPPLPSVDLGPVLMRLAELQAGEDLMLEAMVRLQARADEIAVSLAEHRKALQGWAATFKNWRTWFTLGITAIVSLFGGAAAAK